MSNPSKYGYEIKLPDVPVFGEDHAPPPFDPGKHHPSGEQFGLPKFFPSSAGSIYTGNTPTAAETGMTTVSGNADDSTETKK